MKIAVLGGAFDPIHNGHLQMARYAKKRLHVHEVWFMPTKLSPIKEMKYTSFAQRSKMVKLAISPYRYMRLCTLEEKLKEDYSYTIHTVQELKRRYPNHEFCWLIGEDQGTQYSTWKDSELLTTLVPFYVCSRFSTPIPIPVGLQPLQMPLMDVSSSEIRSGQKLYQLPKAVRNYMGKQGLYIECMVRQKMSEKRYKHSVSVANVCKRLAYIHQLDPHIAYIMGITHDICKELPYDHSRIWMKHHMPESLEVPVALWHSYIGASYIKRVLHIYDKRIYEAVYHHVIGRNKTEYDRLLFIADKIDPSRGYDTSKEYEISKKNLKEGFHIVKQQQCRYLKNKGTYKGV